MFTLVGVAISITVALFAGCARNGYDDYQGGKKPDNEGGPDADAIDVGDDLVDEDGLLDDADAADPKIRKGFNGGFSTPMDGYLKCKINDIDVSKNNLLVQCGPLSNGTFKIAIPSDPTASARAEVNNVAPMRVELDDGSVLVSNSEQVVEAGGGLFVPFNLNDAPAICGVAYSDAEGGAVKMILDPLTSATPYRVRSVAVADDADGAQRLFVLASDKNAKDAGVVVSYPLGEDGELDPIAEGSVIPLKGKKPAAMEKVDAETAIVLDADSSAPAIEVVKLNSADPLVAAESFPLPEPVLPLSEIATDGKHAIIPAASGALLVFDIEQRAVVGTLAGTGQAQGVAVEGGKVYLSYWNDIHIVDISDPAHPVLEQEIEDVGKHLGAIAVKSGIIYVAATARWWEGNDVVADCLAGDPTVVCRSHIIAIDPKKVNP